MSKPFKLIFERDYFEGSDVITISEKEYIIVSTPKMHYWQRIKKFFGFNYDWYYKVKEYENSK